MVLARRLRIVGTPVDWILEINKEGRGDPIIAVVPTGEKVKKYPYNKNFRFPKSEKVQNKVMVSIGEEDKNID